MEWLFLAVGVLLIFAGIVDVFFTVLHPDGFGFLSSRLYDGLFYSVRLITRPIPRKYQALGLSIAAPLMVPVSSPSGWCSCSQATHSSTTQG
jgi:hypothetical protein